MENTLRQIETENIIIYNDYCYGPKIVNATKKFVEDLVRDGVIVKGSFNDDVWKCYSGVKTFDIYFDFDMKEYKKHIGEELKINYKTMKQMLKCYVAYCTGEYVFNTLAREITNTIKKFLCCYKDSDFKLAPSELYYIEDFLSFINTPDSIIDDVLANIKKKAPRKSSARKLATLMHYLIIANEINELFDGDISDREFVKYFPIYFWVNVTFILPLRATEMLVTPFDCIEITDDEIILKVRRTTLKGGKRRVYYDVEKDYKIFTYRLHGIIKKRVFETIKRYQEITKDHERRFLFDYGAAFSNEMFSLSGLNNLIRIFIDEKIKDNLKYEYAKKISGLNEFQYVTAGDSRPIAMANLFSQGAGADICRQLANHMNISTSANYFTNVSETLYYSSIMQMQRWINKELLNEKIIKNNLILKDKDGCTKLEHNYRKDCIGHYFDCYGCNYYFPDDKEIDRVMRERKDLFENNIKKMQNILINTNKIKGRDIDMDELFLKVHTAGARYKESTDIYAEKEAKKWVNEQSTQTIYC